LPGGQVWQIEFTDAEAVGLPVFFPLDTGGQWVPREEGARVRPGVCGGIFVDEGDQPGEVRVTRDGEGSRFDVRGAATLDILGPDRAVLLPELDISGAGFSFFGADGSAEFEFAAPNALWAFPEEVDPWKAAGLPVNFYFTEGTFAETISPEGDVELISVPTDAVDLCSLLPAS